MPDKALSRLAIPLLLLCVLLIPAACVPRTAEKPQAADDPAPSGRSTPTPTVVTSTPEPKAVVETEPAAPQGEPAPPFSLDDCGCTPIELPLVEYMSRATKNPIQYTTLAGTQFDAVQLLRCHWAEYMANGSWISLDLLMVRLNSAGDGRALLGDFRNWILSEQPLCEFIDCTVQVAEDTAERVFYVVHFSSAGDLTLPSTHRAWLTRLISTDGGDFVINLRLTHSELEMGSSWAVDMTTILENCALDIVNRE
jgi:hypothetical protein